MIHYCAACGKRIAGIHVVNAWSLRYHHRCYRPELHDPAQMPREPEPKDSPKPKRKPKTPRGNPQAAGTQTYRDLQALLSMLNDTPIMRVTDD